MWSIRATRQIGLFRLRDLLDTLRSFLRLATWIRREIDLVHTNSLKADLIGGFAALLALRRFVGMRMIAWP